MPTLESNRRIIGRGLIQLFVTEEGGEGMVKTGSFISTGVVKSYNIGFKPKTVLLALEETTGEEEIAIYTEFGYISFYDYDITDYNGYDKTSTKHGISQLYSNDCIFTDTGFNLKVQSGDGFYIAIG